MSSIPVFVGLDYHHESIQVCVLDSSGKVLANRAVGNSAVAVHDVVRRCGQPVRIGVEACCGAANLAHQLRAEYGLPINLGHPGYVSRMKGSPDKSDRSDAMLLADLARVNYLPKVWLAPDSIRELRRMTRHRQQLVARQRALKLRIRGLLRENRLSYSQARPWTKAWLKWLRQEAPLAPNDRWILEDHLQELESLKQRLQAAQKHLQEVSADDPVVSLLMSLDGVGLVTALTLRAEIGEFDRFRNGKQLARFCGITPRNASSGQRQADAGLIKAGNPLLRAMLVELAHRLIYRQNEKWARLGLALIQRGKPTNVAVAAVANRWVRWLYHEVTTRMRPVAELSSGSTEGGRPSPLASASPQPQ